MTAPSAPPHGPPALSPAHGALTPDDRRAAAWRRDAVAGGLWMVAVVPAAVGFWRVGGSLAGIGTAQVATMVAASLLALGIATLLQVALGLRLPVYEGPAAAYLAAITVITAEGQHSLGAITGGLIAAGSFVALLGVLGADRLIAKAFTPLVANVFVLTVTLALIPDSVERAIGATGGLPGRGAAWAGSAMVVVVAIACRRVRRLIPYSLLAALVLGTATYLAVAGTPHVHLGGTLSAPALLPWGRPRLNAEVVIPFLLAGALAAFNTVATGRVASIAHDLELGAPAQRRSFVAHGASQAGTAVFGNLVGTVSRVDSVGIARLLGHRGRTPLLLCGVLVGGLAFVRPFVQLVAALPLSVSAALLVVLLALILFHAASGIAAEPAAVVAAVVVPAMLPTLVWITVGSSLPPTVQLLANPMLWGVLLAMVLERIVVARRASSRAGGVAK